MAGSCEGSMYAFCVLLCHQVKLTRCFAMLAVPLLWWWEWLQGQLPLPCPQPFAASNILAWRSVWRALWVVPTKTVLHPGQQRLCPHYVVSACAHKPIVAHSSLPAAAIALLCEGMLASSLPCNAPSKQHGFQHRTTHRFCTGTALLLRACKHSIPLIGFSVLNMLPLSLLWCVWRLQFGFCADDNSIYCQKTTCHPIYSPWSMRCLVTTQKAPIKRFNWVMGVFVTREHVRHNKSGITHRGKTRISH
jgi:hypothetical protein